MPIYTYLRLHLIHALRAWINWIEPPPSPPVPDESSFTITLQKDALYEKALSLTAQASGWSTFSGEAKRHAVYARLQKDFPDLPHRTLGLIIEAVL